ncbi:MAG: hypothetical protein ACXWZL_08765, partial [Mycobacterium sp.]
MIAEARRQFELAWSLAELHLAALVEETSHGSRRTCAGRSGGTRRVWRPDWAGAEPIRCRWRGHLDALERHLEGRQG